MACRRRTFLHPESDSPATDSVVSDFQKFPFTQKKLDSPREPVNHTREKLGFKSIGDALRWGGSCGAAIALLRSGFREESGGYPISEGTIIRPLRTFSSRNQECSTNPSSANLRTSRT